MNKHVKPLLFYYVLLTNYFPVSIQKLNILLKKCKINFDLYEYLAFLFSVMKAQQNMKKYVPFY